MDKTGIMKGAFPSSLRPHPSSLAEWDPEFLARSPMFEPLRAHAPVPGAEWPRLVDLQRTLDASQPPVRNASGMPLRLVPPGRKLASLEEKYEARLYLRGELLFREDDWHDYFNVLVWLAFPAPRWRSMRATTPRCASRSPRVRRIAALRRTR